MARLLPPARLTLQRALRGPVGSLLLRASSWLFLGAALSRIASVAATIIVARVLVPQNLGRLTLLQTAVTLFAGLSGSGVVLGVTRQVAETRSKDAAQAGRYVGVALLLTVAASVIVTGVYLLAGQAFCTAVLRDSSLAEFVPASAAAVGVTAINASLQSALTGLEAFRIAAAAQAALALGTAVGLVVGAKTNGINGALIGTAIGQFVVAIPTAAALHRLAAREAIPISYGFHRAEAQRLFELGVPAFVAFLSVTVAGIAGQVLLATSTHGYQRLAAFAVAYRWHLAIVFVPAAIVPALLPLMSRLRAEERHGHVLSLFRATLWLTVVIAAVPAALIAAGAPLVMRLSGPFYASDTLPLVILAAAAVPCAVNSVLSGASVSLGAMRAWLFSDLVLAGGLVLTALWLVGPHGATGLALAYLVAYIATDIALAPPLQTRLRALVRPA